MAQSAAQRRQEQIMDDTLKRVYGEVENECVPERIQLLLEALRKEEQARAKSE